MPSFYIAYDRADSPKRDDNGSDSSNTPRSIDPRHDIRRRRFNCRFSPSLMILSIACLFFRGVIAVLLPFDNCLPDDYVYSDQTPDQVQLQWVPLYMDAKFDLKNSTHELVITVWGNVTGKVGTDPLPAWNNATWNQTDGALWGKIQNEPDPSDPNPKLTTLHSKVDVVTYEPYSWDENFCENLVNGSCPLGPVFNTTEIAMPYGLPAFNLTNQFFSTYAFTSFTPTLIILYGDSQATTIGCISAKVTPSLGGIAWFLRFLPLFVLLFVGAKTVFAGIFSPWGTNDVFHFTSNYGRDPDLLRLVTPGFGDCLQYIQFIVLTGALTLDYPGFYQPAVSNAAWSTLMFNESFVSKADPWESLVDGVYFTNGTYGLNNLAQLIGMAEPEDIWAGMIVWLLCIVGAILIAVQVGFAFRWFLRYVNRIQEEDLRAKNFPFSMGNIIRLVFSYFLLPIVTLSTFQLVEAGQSAIVLVVMAVVTILLIMCFAAWLMYFIVTTRPRSHLFDDLPTVLLYGPLYNTYSDEAAAFALIPILLTFLRGIALGAVQPSGIAQIVILAVCEVIQVLTLHAFRPFHSPTSMNAYHTGFAAFRFVTVLLMVAFAPSMGVTEGPKGWIGYVILVMHGSVLIFGFFLNALQTIIEVIARLCGAGGDDIRGQTRGGLSKIFGARQLQRRVSRRGAVSRQSQLSTATMLTASKSTYGRARSESAGSMGVLLNGAHQRSSSVLAQSIDGYSGPIERATPTTVGETATFSFLPAPGQATRPQPAADPYYRQPRARRQTMSDIGAIGGGGDSSPEMKRASVASAADLGTKRLSQIAPYRDNPDVDGPASGRTTPAPAPYAPVFAPRTDYSTREVDFYYGVRGPALNSDGPGRKLGTGPRDPTSPVSTARGWLKGLFGGKTKEKGKGFEVVRSSRMPPGMMRAGGGDFSDDGAPEGIPVAMGVLRNGPIESDEEDSPQSKKKHRSTTSAKGELLDEAGEPRNDDEDDVESPKVSDNPPLLPDLDTGGDFNVPSRIASKASRKPSEKAIQGVKIGPVPELPRRSSKRNSSGDRMKNPSFNLVPPSEASSSKAVATNATTDLPRSLTTATTASARLPFDRTNSQKRLSGSSVGLEELSQLASSGVSGDSGDERPTSFGHVHQGSISRVDPASNHDLLGTTAEVLDADKKLTPTSSASTLNHGQSPHPDDPKKKDKDNAA